MSSLSLESGCVTTNSSPSSSISSLISPAGLLPFLPTQGICSIIEKKLQRAINDINSEIMLYKNECEGREREKEGMEGGIVTFCLKSLLHDFKLLIKLRSRR